MNEHIGGDKLISNKVSLDSLKVLQDKPMSLIRQVKNMWVGHKSLLEMKDKYKNEAQKDRDKAQRRASEAHQQLDALMSSTQSMRTQAAVFNAIIMNKSHDVLETASAMLNMEREHN